MGKDRKADQPKFALLDKNLCNFPLARDARVNRNVRWFRGKRTGDWRAELPGEPNIELRFRSEVRRSLRRCPTALDINVLLTAIAAATRDNGNEVRFESCSEIVRAVGLSVDKDSLRRVREALGYWSVARICFDNWYSPNCFTYLDAEGRSFSKSAKGLQQKRTKRSARGPRKLPPPVEWLEWQSRGVRVRINREWCEMQQRYFEKIPLPLPRNAAAQNLILCLLVSMLRYDSRENRTDPHFTYPRKVRRLCRKIGLNHSTRNRVLRHVIDDAAAWFRQNGGALTAYIKDGSVTFAMKKPSFGKHARSTHRSARASTQAPTSSSEARVENDQQRLETLITEFEANIRLSGRSDVLDDADGYITLFRRWLKKKGIALDEDEEEALGAEYQIGGYS